MVQIVLKETMGGGSKLFSLDINVHPSYYLGKITLLTNILPKLSLNCQQ